MEYPEPYASPSPAVPSDDFLLASLLESSGTEYLVCGGNPLLTDSSYPHPFVGGEAKGESGNGEEDEGFEGKEIVTMQNDKNNK